MDVSVKTMEPKKVVYLRHTGPYDQIGPIWEKLFMWAGPKGLLGPDMEVFALYHDNPEITPMDQLRSDVCIVADGEMELTGDFKMQETQGGDYAVVIHKGPYEALTDVYIHLYGQWAMENGREPRNAPCMEYYLNDPNTTPPDELLTRVCIPLV